MLDETIAESVAIPRLRTLLVGGLAGMPAILSLLGVYGVLAFSIAQGTKEIGVGTALGARARTVISDVVRAGLKLVLAGVGVGLLAAWVGAEVVSGFLFEITPTDPAIYVSVVAGVLAVSCIAAYLPARRAVTVDPVSVLNREIGRPSWFVLGKREATQAAQCEPPRRPRWPF